MQEYVLFLQRHEGLSLVFGGLLLLLIIVESLRLKRRTGQLNPLQLTNLLNHQDALVVDLRSPAQFTAGHIIGAVSLPICDFKDKAKKLDKYKTRPLALVCEKGTEALKYANELKAEGFNAHSLGGGLASWIAADLPLVEGDK